MTEFNNIQSSPTIGKQKQYSPKLQEMIDDCILDLEFTNDDIDIFTFYGKLKSADDREAPNHNRSMEHFCCCFGGFVIDKDENILKGVYNVFDNGKMLLPQFITKSDNLKMDYVIWRTGANRPMLMAASPIKIQYSNTAIAWLNCIKRVHDGAEHPNDFVTPLSRINIVTKEYIKENIKEYNDNMKLEAALGSQLRCAQIIKSGLKYAGDVVGNGLQSGLGIAGGLIEDGIKKGITRISGAIESASISGAIYDF